MNNEKLKVYPIEAYEVYEDGAIDAQGFYNHGKRLKPGYSAPPEPKPVKPSTEHEAARFAIEAISGGKNTLLYDDLGLPSVMVRIPRFNWSDVFEEGEDKPCSAFIVKGRILESIYISKFLNVVEHGRAYSLPARNPAALYNIEEARAACAAKGTGWHLMSNAEYMAIAHWCRKNGHLPRGNSYHGNNFTERHEVSVRKNVGAFGDKILLPNLTGTGPDTWTHDGTPLGIADLCGNLWDMLSGLRMNNGEINIIPDNDSAAGVDESADSPNWRAIRTDGTLVPPGAEGTYKYDYASSGLIDDTFACLPDGVFLSAQVRNPMYKGDNPDTNHSAYTISSFRDMIHSPDAVPHPLIKQLGIYPAKWGVGDPRIFARNYGDRPAYRGGSWFDRDGAGLWTLYMRDNRTWIAEDCGFRCAYVELG